MISLGTALHLAACAADRARLEVAEIRRLVGWGLVLIRLGQGGRRG